MKKEKKAGNNNTKSPHQFNTPKHLDVFNSEILSNSNTHTSIKLHLNETY